MSILIFTCRFFIMEIFLGEFLCILYYPFLSRKLFFQCITNDAWGSTRYADTSINSPGITSSSGCVRSTNSSECIQAALPFCSSSSELKIDHLYFDGILLLSMSILITQPLCSLILNTSLVSRVALTLEAVGTLVKANALCCRSQSCSHANAHFWMPSTCPVRSKRVPGVLLWVNCNEKLNQSIHFKMLKLCMVPRWQDPSCCLQQLWALILLNFCCLYSL